MLDKLVTHRPEGRATCNIGITVRGLSAHPSVLHAAGLYASRALVGLGEGVAPSGATDMVARVIAKNERARAISFIFSGLHVGSLLGLLVAPPLIENFGWETVFYIFGIAGGSDQKVQCCRWPVTFAFCSAVGRIRHTVVK